MSKQNKTTRKKTLGIYGMVVVLFLLIQTIGQARFGSGIDGSGY